MNDSIESKIKNNLIKGVVMTGLIVGSAGCYETRRRPHYSGTTYQSRTTPPVYYNPRPKIITPPKHHYHPKPTPHRPIPKYYPKPTIKPHYNPPRINHRETPSSPRHYHPKPTIRMKQPPKHYNPKPTPRHTPSKSRKSEPGRNSSRSHKRSM